MALKNIKVIELLGLAPAPFCGMLLADFGASVTIVDKIQPQAMNVLSSGKKHISLNLKHEKGRKILMDMCKTADVLIEPFRPGVMEKNKVGPKDLMKANPKLIYARLTGYGQIGEMSQKAGHDINYVALSGVLSLLGRKNSNPHPPINLAADFAGGGLMCALGIVMALFERVSSNKGQVVDASMVEGTAYVASWLFRSQGSPIWGNKRGENILDGGAHFYDTYETKDGKYLAVGAIEPKFYDSLLQTLKISDDNQFEKFDEKKDMFKDIFLQKTQKEWMDLFDTSDACVTPILSIDEAPTFPHNNTRNSFVKDFEGRFIPTPAPKLDRTPGESKATLRPPYHGEHTVETLLNLNYTGDYIRNLEEEGVIYSHKKSNL